MGTDLPHLGSDPAASQVPDLLTEKNAGMRLSEISVPWAGDGTGLVEGLTSTHDTLGLTA